MELPDDKLLANCRTINVISLVAPKLFDKNSHLIASNDAASG
ncbi:hypothetical protein [Bartonella sp. M0283]|nr:hypothetical protein [Bartonella sp. M0283]